jgi:hypothetical protein
MAEFKIMSFPKAEPIIFNYDELKAELTEKAKTYETLVYTEKTVGEAKTDRANLNKLKKALNDERIRREKEYLEPFADFKAKMNEIIGIIDKPVQIIDAQVKAFENAEKEQKKAEVEKIWESIDHPDWLNLEKIWNEKWLNKTYGVITIENEIRESLKRIDVEISTVNGLAEFGFEAMDVYKQTLDVTRAIAESQRLAEQKKRKEEAETKKAAEENAKTPNTEPMPETPKDDAKWIGFQARLTVPQALELKKFFNDRNIEFKPIK